MCWDMCWGLLPGLFQRGKHDPADANIPLTGDASLTQCASVKRASRMGHAKFKIADERNSAKLFDEAYGAAPCCHPGDNPGAN